MNRLIRAVLLITGAVSLVAAVGFFIQAPWAVALWPFKVGRLSYIFLSSILAAIGSPVLWIGLAGEPRAMAGGGINLAVANLGGAIFSTQLYLRDRAAPLLVFAIVLLLLALFSAATFFYGRRFAFHDARPTPGLVRISFGIFVVTLTLAGGAMVLKRPNIFPWPLTPDTSVYFGWIFLGAMLYFLYGLIYPRWANARGQLIGFLAYDLVLIVPFLLLFQTVRPDLRTSLTIYTGVLIFSGAVAVYYLFIHRETRFHLTRRGKATLAAQL